MIAGLVVAVALSFAPTIAPAQAQDTEAETQRVVVLNGSDPYLPAFLALDSAMRDAVRAGRKEPTELYAETLDMYRFQGKNFENDLVEVLRKKYAHFQVDVVVATGLIALEFAESNLAKIWPGATIVFYSIPADMLRERNLDPRTIGLPEQVDFGQTLDLALHLRPATREIVVIAGTSEPDRKHLAFARTELERVAGRLDIRYLAGLTLTETLEAVRALTADTIVLYVMMFRDGAGMPQVPRDVLTEISAASRAPVFGVFETYLGYGIAAGSIASYEAQGRTVGALVARVLDGEDPAAIGVQAPVASSCIADWRQLRHWRIDERLVPADCEVRFREITAWDRYHWQILAVMAVTIAQTGLIVALMLNRRRLRNAQAALQEENDRRSQAEAVAVRLQERLARFSKERTLGAMATTIAHEINQPLIAIQNYAQAVKRRLESDVYEKSRIIELFTKIEGQAERAGAITQRVRSLVNSAEPHLMPTPLCPLLEEVIRMMEPEIDARGCRITCEPVSGLPEVLADPLQVQLVLVNLLQNAIQSVCASDRYDRRVSVDVRPVDDREVQISVTDRGGGIPPERIEDVFESLDSGTNIGMGMGLAICRDIIGAHGGRIWYEPNPAGGAIFRFTLQKADDE